MNRFVCAVLLGVVMCGGCGGDHVLTNKFDQGWWRGEFMSSTGTVGEQWPEREEDYFLLAAAEYEWPVQDRITLAARGYPLFFYNLRGSVKDRKDDIFGVGVGAALRFYAQEIKSKGFYGEIGSAVLWHDDYMPGNGSKVNFLSDAGIGYDFGNSWAVTLKIFHLSNAGLDDDNAGFDGLTFGVSKTF